MPAVPALPAMPAMPALPALPAMPAALAALPVLALAVLAGACSRAPSCRDDVVQGIPSPDGAAIAFVYRRSCPAGSAAAAGTSSPALDVSTNVSIIDFHAALRDGPGNVLSVANEQTLKAAWSAPKELHVAGFGPPVLYRADTLGAVTVRFTESSGP